MFSNILLFVLLHASHFSTNEVHDYPKGHIKYHFKDDSQYCHADDRDCKVKSTSCWGYEDDCTPEKRFFRLPKCDKHQSHGTPKENVEKFWYQGDFGYVKEKVDTLEFLCQPEKEGDSMLICNDKWEHCTAENLFMDFRKKNFDTTERFDKHFFFSGEVGGSCSIKPEHVKRVPQLQGELNSWYSELDTFKQMNTQVSPDSQHCDEFISKPTIFMKLDAGVNMFHHFCDFLNLYASQHINGSFSTDVYIVMWDTSKSPYGDLFEETWKAFTQYPLKRLSDFEGKRVCFRNAMFPLLPRMMFGLFYNMPLVQHCKGGGLFKAFSEHVLHRLGIFQHPYQDDEVRVTLLLRSTKYRKIINSDELIGAMKRVKGISVEAVDYQYREMPFIEQLKITHNSDIFIGIHGAGLTHMLFQPDWGAVFEIYNTEDPDCYRDLASLRGLQYFTWERQSKLFQEDEGHHPTLGAHAKFTNYAFDVDEFMRILTKAIKHVLSNRPANQDN